MSAMMRHRFRATIAPQVLQRKTYQNRPHRTRAEELELDEAQVQRMERKLVGKPFLYNHKDKVRIGTILASYRHPHDASWMIEYGIDDNTVAGKSALHYIQTGQMTGVSLRHIPGVDEPEEVSACWKGARGPESRTHADPSDPRHLSRPLLGHEGNSNPRYSTDSDRSHSLHHAISASSEQDYSRDYEEFFCVVTHQVELGMAAVAASEQGGHPAGFSATASGGGGAPPVPGASAAAYGVGAPAGLAPPAAGAAAPAPPVQKTASPFASGPAAVKSFLTKDGRTVSFAASGNKKKGKNQQQAAAATAKLPRSTRRVPAQRTSTRRTAQQEDEDMEERKGNDVAGKSHQHLQQSANGHSGEEALQGDDDDGDEDEDDDDDDETGDRMLDQIEQENAEFHNIVQDTNVPLSAEKLKMLQDHLRKRDHSIVKAQTEKMRLAQQVRILMAERAEREAVAQQAAAETEQKRVEEENASKSLEVQVAMDFMATFQPESTPQQRESYHAQLMKMSLDDLRLTVAGQRQALEKTKQNAPSPAAAHINEIRSKYRHTMEQYSAPEKFMPPGFSQNVHKQQQQMTGGGGQNAQKPAVAAAYMGSSWDSSSANQQQQQQSQSETTGWDPIEWAKSYSPALLGSDAAYARGPTARRVMASYTTDSSVYCDGSEMPSQEEEQNTRVEYVNGVRVRRQAISAAAEMDKKVASVSLRRGEGPRFPFQHIHPSVRLATLAVWQGKRYQDIPRVAGSGGPETLYHHDFLKDYYAYTNRDTLHMSTQQDLVGSAMER
jgi:hypothetical protein